MQLRKLAATALGAILAGSTLGAAASAASLADYPAPFVEDADANFSMVVGEQAATMDVASAMDVAVTLGGQPAEERSVEVEGTAEWSAEYGMTLNRPNDNLFLNDKTDSGIDALVEGDLDILADQTFEDGDDEEIEVEYELGMGENDQAYDADSRRDEVGLYVDIDDVEAEGEYLFSFDAFFDDEVNFTHEDLENEEVKLFGRTYEVSDDTDGDELVLYGDSVTETGLYREDLTIEINDNEHTLNVRYVDDAGDEATVRVDGTTESLEEGDTVTLSGQEVRVRDIFRTGPDGEGEVVFGLGSEEMVLEHGQEVELDGEEVDATEVYFEADEDDNPVEELEEISIYYGAHDRDSRFVEAGDYYEDPIFGLEFHYGGASPDAAEDPAETLEVAGGDEEATLVMTDDSGDEADIEFLWEGELGNEDGSIAAYEGEEVELDDYFVLNFDERASMFEVTDVDYEFDDEDAESIVEFENVFTGDVIELDEDDFEDPGQTGDDDADGTHVADFRLNRVSYEVTVESGDVITVSQEDQEDIPVFPNVYSETDAAVAFLDDEAVTLANDGEEAEEINVRLPSTKSSGDTEVTINDDGSIDGEYDDDLYTISAAVDGEDWDGDVTVTADGVTGPSLLVIQPEDEDGDEHAFITEFTYDEDDEETEIADVHGFDDAGFGFVDFEEEDDLEATYSYYGTYAEWDTDDEGEVEVSFPEFESTVGMAVTEEGGSLGAEALADVTYRESVPITHPVSAIDTEVEEPADIDEDLILVGGPSANTLVEDLAQEHDDIATSEEWEENIWDDEADEPGEWAERGVLHLVEDAFQEGQTALIVAGATRDQTRELAAQLQNFEDLPDDTVFEL